MVFAGEATNDRLTETEERPKLSGWNAFSGKGRQADIWSQISSDLPCATEEIYYLVVYLISKSP